MPTPLFLNGFENRVFAVGGSNADGLWASITGTAPTTEQTIHHGAGASSMHCASPAGSAYQSSNFCDAFASQTLLAYRIYFYKSGNPSTPVVIASVSPAGSTFFTVQLWSDGTVSLRTSGGTTPTHGSLSSALSSNAWHWIDVVIDVSTTSFTARMWIDDTLMTTDAHTTGAAAGSIVQMNIGIVNSVTISTARDWYFDDWIIGTASDLNDRFGQTDGIVALVPNADGTHSPSPPTAGRFKDAGGTDISGSNAAWDNLDAGDLTQTAERVSQPVAASTEYLEVAFGTTTLSAAAPVAVQGEAALNTDGTNAFSASTRMRNGAAETVIFTGDWSIAAGTKVYKKALVTVADQGELDGLTMRLGYGSSQPATPYWEGLMYEVDIGVASFTTYEKEGSLVASSNLSGADVSERVEAGAALAKSVLSGIHPSTFTKDGSLLGAAILAGTDASTYAELGSVLAKSVMSGLDAGIFNELGAILGRPVLSGVDIAEYAELGAILALSRISGSDISEHPETGAILSASKIAGEAVFVASVTGGILAKSILSGTSIKDVPPHDGSILGQSAVSGADASTYAELGAVLGKSALSGSDAIVYSEAGSLIGASVFKGADSYNPAETGAILAGALLSGADAEIKAEAGALLAKALLAGADFFVATESGSLLAGGTISASSLKTLPGKSGDLLSKSVLSGADSAEHARLGSVLGSSLFRGADAEIVNKMGALIAASLLAGVDQFTAVESGAILNQALIAATDASEHDKPGSILASSLISGEGGGTLFVVIFATTPAGHISRAGQGEARGPETGHISRPQTGHIRRPLGSEE